MAAEEHRWRVGAVQPLGDDDDSPFLGESSFREMHFAYAGVKLWFSHAA